MPLGPRDRAWSINALTAPLSSYNLLYLPSAQIQPEASGQGAWCCDLIYTGKPPRAQCKVERGRMGIWRDKQVPSIHLPFCTSESGAGTSELTSTSKATLIRPIRITSSVFYVCLFNFKRSAMCCRHTSSHRGLRHPEL